MRLAGRAGDAPRAADPGMRRAGRGGRREAAGGLEEGGAMEVWRWSAAEVWWGRREGKAAEMVVGGGDGERRWGGDEKTRRADGTRADRLRPSDFVEGNEPAS